MRWRPEPKSRVGRLTASPRHPTSPLYTLKQWLQSGRFYPPGHTWPCLESFLVATTSEVVLPESSGWGPGMWPQTPQCTGQLPQRESFCFKPWKTLSSTLKIFHLFPWLLCRSRPEAKRRDFKTTVIGPGPHAVAGSLLWRELAHPLRSRSPRAGDPPCVTRRPSRPKQ